MAKGLPPGFRLPNGSVPYDEGSPEREAFREGVAASVSGVALEANPYLERRVVGFAKYVGTRCAEAWTAGHQSTKDRLLPQTELGLKMRGK